VLSKADLRFAGGTWGSYRDVDGDGTRLTYRNPTERTISSAAYSREDPARRVGRFIREKGTPRIRQQQTACSRKLETASKAPASVVDEASGSSVVDRLVRLTTRRRSRPREALRRRRTVDTFGVRRDGPVG